MHAIGAGRRSCEAGYTAKRLARCGLESAAATVTPRTLFRREAFVRSAHPG
jgi:hypothetical protein